MQIEHYDPYQDRYVKIPNLYTLKGEFFGTEDNKKENGECHGCKGNALEMSKCVMCEESFCGACVVIRDKEQFCVDCTKYENLLQILN